MPGISIWPGLWKWLLAIKVLVWKRRFCGRDRGGGPGQRPGSKWTERIPWESYLPTRNCCKKPGFDDSLVQKPVFSRVFSCPCFQNPVFCLLFKKKLQPRRQSTGPRRDQIEPERPQKHRVLETCWSKWSLKPVVLHRSSAQTPFFLTFSYR